MSSQNRIFRTKALFAGVIGAALVTAGCSEVNRYHGYAPTAQDVAAIAVGTTTKAQVAATLGAPTSEGGLLANAYYYAASQFAHVGALAPREVAREVVVVRFDSADRVTDIARYTLQDGNVVRIDRRETDDGIDDVSIIRQRLGSAGRFDPATLIDEA